MSSPTSRRQWNTGAGRLGSARSSTTRACRSRTISYRGERYEPHNSVALANSGSVQVELIQPRNDVPSMYRDFLRAGHTGLQHVACWTENYDADLKRLLAQGFKPVMGGEVGQRGRFVYFDTEYHPGAVVELS